ncbi:TonB-dependent receptor [Exilibacterium tricleocarpae]|uniref:TonB-dependent receptor n=1 Tax=Exilibacterium tricleocarpae TaxID=2591008 RepID=A0A545U6N0_9GAMM|nr:TonB-dependent receptor [Exilibacterium tricleocarpae]TQV85125.1 TonB-dependent receptor [Exilibacterium tricleocarpae]
MRKVRLAAAVAAVVSNSVASFSATGAEATEAGQVVESRFHEEITIVGSQDEVRNATGSAHFIGAEELQQFAYSDIQRIARQVPGVSIQVEDGYGLRPNISIRGVATERSGRITLLEDNVLIAPAPYSAPSAYYFPTVGRMHAFEVVKGPAAITQGPYTIGGALNMVSTPIPQDLGGDLLFEAGEDTTYRMHATYGGELNNGFGFLLETHQWQSDGFQDIDRSGSDTGLDIKDYTVKLSYAPEGSPHSVKLKLQYADQDSNQSYLGLTDADFNDDAFRRYGLSALDNIETEHEQVILRYQFQISDALSLSATAYNNEHERDWFKTEGVDLDGSANAGDFDRTSWASIINAINSGDSVDGFSPAQLQGILDGTQDTVAGSIQLRSNAREYYSRGIQLGLNWEGQLGGATHSLEVGVRVHEDEEDRLQRNSTYSQRGGALVLDDLGELGNAGNRVQEAEALAVHIYDRIEFGDWVFTPGLRYEDIEQKRTRYNDGAARTFRDSRENDTSVWLPGLGVLYNVNDEVVLLGGVHKGFTAPSNSPGVEEEEAINYELGVRYQSANLSTEVVAFLSDYDNLLGECTSSSGSDCEIGEAFNGDAATVKGIEVLASANLMSGDTFAVPLTFTYTYIDGEFDTDIADTDFFGDVNEGDPIPYIPENQFQLTVGIEQVRWAAYLNANYVDEVCVRASCEAFEETDDSLTVDLSGNYQLTEQLNLFARVENLTGEEDILGRQPYGARPNKDRTASVGVRFSF